MYNDAQVLKCRQLLALCRDVIASPTNNDKAFVDIITSVQYWKQNKLQPLCEKLGMEIAESREVERSVMQICFGYSLKFRISMHWNQVNHLLIKGPEFITCKGKMEAIGLDVVVADGHIAITAKPHAIRNPPPYLDNFDICEEAQKHFFADENYTIENHSIFRKWCHVLPTMKRGQLVKITHDLQTSKSSKSASPFTDYEGLKLYWKNHYGIRLPEASKGLAFCHVHFRLIGRQLFTYPLCCMRTSSIQVLPRCDGPAIIKDFINCVQQKMSSFCDQKLIMSTKPCYVTNKISESTQIKVGRLHNVTMTKIETETKTPPVPTRPNARKTSTEEDNLDIIPPSQPDLKRPIGELLDRFKCEKIKTLQTNADGKFIPVFAACGRKISESKTSLPNCRLTSKGSTKSKQQGKRLNTAARVNQTTPRTSVRPGISLEKSFKTPRRLYNLSDSGYDSNETPAAQKNPADIELTKRYLPKKLSFESHGKNVAFVPTAHEPPHKPSIKSHRFDSLFTKAGACEQAPFEDIQILGERKSDSPPVHTMQNHSFDKLFTTARQAVIEPDRSFPFNTNGASKKLDNRVQMVENDSVECRSYPALFQLKDEDAYHAYELNCSNAKQPVGMESSIDESYYFDESSTCSRNPYSIPVGSNVNLKFSNSQNVKNRWNPVQKKKQSFDEIFRSAGSMPGGMKDLDRGMVISQTVTL